MASSPKLRSIPAESIQDMPDWFEPVLQMLNGYLGDAGNAFDALLGKANADSIETEWIEIPSSKLESSWVYEVPPRAPPAYKRFANGWVVVRGYVQHGVIGGAIYTLPEGFRPAYEETFAIDSASAHGRATVSNSGVITAFAGSATYFGLSGIAFQAAQKRRS